MDKLTSHSLFMLCSMIQGAKHAVVFSVSPDKASYTPSAFWPNKSSNVQYAAAAVKLVLAKKQCILLQHKRSEREPTEIFDVIACPLFVDKQLHSVIAIQISNQAAAQQQRVMLQVEKAAVYFAAIISQHSPLEKSQLVALLELVASCLEHERFHAAATDAVTDLAIRFSCNRVSLGFLHGHTVTVEAVSHSAGFDRRSSLIRHIGEAMQEAIAQDCTLLYPTASDTVFLTRCHAALAQGDETVLTIPFAAGRKIVGALMFARPSAHPFDQLEVASFLEIAALIGPVLDVRRRDEQGLLQRLTRSRKRLLAQLFGPGHSALKCGVAAFLLCMAVLTFASGEYRITSAARVEALMQRVVVAPQDGYIAEAKVRPGDIIARGDLLAALDDKDLHLEQQKWSSQLEQLRTEQRDALARHDRSQVAIIKARILQAEAQLNLVNEQLIRTRFTAPFNGVIVSGDLSQSIGAPVERGQVLFTVAPLNAYRIILAVDERDIGQVKEGQSGNLVLSSMPRKAFLFTVEKITPVSTAEEGGNYFQVEAKMEKKSDLLRPGMEGIAKVEINRRKLIWIWSHRLVDWFRLSVWAWQP